MGYRPNLFAAALRQGSRKKFLHSAMPVAIVKMPLQFEQKISEGKRALYPMNQITSGIVRRAGELGYRVETFTPQSPRELSILLKSLYARGFQGIFLPAVRAVIQLEAREWAPFSIVACGRYDQPVSFHSVRQEIFEDNRLLYNQVILRGYRRICAVMLSHKPKLLDDFAREAARDACRPPGGEKLHLVIFPTDKKPSELVALVKKERLDAVVGFSDTHYHYLKDAGIKIPEDVGYVALHITQKSDATHQPISGLVPLHDYTGVVAANRMDAMIRHRERGIPPVREQTVIESQWQEGSTLPFRRLA
jgi:DNA-binding LacI/PurR family transcriptional regulator